MLFFSRFLFCSTFCSLVVVDVDAASAANDQQAGGAASLPPARLVLAFKDNKTVVECCSSTCVHSDKDVFSNAQLLNEHVEAIMSNVACDEEQKEGPVCPWGKCGLRLASRQGLRHHMKAIHCNLVYALEEKNKSFFF